jgi:hypothetical protein
MNNKKFKVGDRVRIIDCSCVEPYELNKVGLISRIVENSYIVDMGRPRRKNEPNLFCWWLGESDIELVFQPNTQLVFNFMYE